MTILTSTAIELNDASMAAPALCDDHTTLSFPTSEEGFTREDWADLIRLRAEFVKADIVVNRSLRERLLTLVEFFFLLAEYGGASAAALQAEYRSAGIKSRMNDWRKAAMLFLGLDPKSLPQGAERNKAYGRVKTVGRVLEAINTDLEVGNIKGDETDSEVIAAHIEFEGGWVKFADRTLGNESDDETDDEMEDEDKDGDHAQSAENSAAAENDAHDATEADRKLCKGGRRAKAVARPQKLSTSASSTDASSTSSEEATLDDPKPAPEPAVLDLADFRSRISAAGIPATTARAISAPEPQLSLICGNDDGELLILPVDAPVDFLRRLKPFLPAADAIVDGHIQAWTLITSAVQFFDRTDSSLPVDADAEAYEGQALLPSLPTILFSSDRSMSIAPARAKVSPIIQVELANEYRLEGWDESKFFVDGRGTNSLIKNLCRPEERAGFEAPKLSRDGKLTFSPRNPGARKGFYVRLNPRTSMGSSLEQDYWVVKEQGFQAAATAILECTDDGLPEQLVKWANSAGAKRKSVKVSVISAGVSLSVGSSVKSKFQAAVTGSSSAEVRPIDFAKAIKFATIVKARNCTIGIDPNGMVALQLGTPFADFKVFIPTLFEGARERKLLEEVRKA